MIAIICPDCRTESNAETNAEACPACGFHFIEKGALPLAKTTRPVGTIIVLLAGFAGTLFLVGLVFF